MSASLYLAIPHLRAVETNFPMGAKIIGDSEATSIVHFSQVVVVSWQFEIQGLGFCASTDVGATCSFLHLLPHLFLGVLWAARCCMKFIHSLS